MHESSMEPDVDFAPDVPYISSSDLESSLLISESISVETSPLLFQIKKNKVLDLSKGTKLKLKQKFLRTQETFRSCSTRSDGRIY